MEAEEFQSAVEFALASKECRQGLWARRIVDVLERHVSNGAIKWGIAVIFEACDEGQSNRCVGWLRRLEQIVSVPQNVEAATCETAAQDIWYFEPPIDNIQRAVSRLYFAWSRFLACDEPAYFMEVSRAMQVYSHSPTESGKIVDEPFSRAIGVAIRMLRDST